MKRNAVFFLTTAVILLSGCAHSIGETGDSSGTSALFPSSNESSQNEFVETSTLNSSDSENYSEIVYEPFRGLPKDDEPISTVNCKEFRPSLLCYGDGNTFFMWNGTVYKHDGKATKALFERNAYNLNYKDGKLYFIENNSYDVNGNDYVHIEGLLYYYDLNTGVLEQISHESISQPIVVNNGFFFTKYSTHDAPFPTGIFQYDERTKQSERLYDGWGYIEYGGFRLKYIPSDTPTFLFFKDNKEYLLNNISPPSWDCISGDYYYFISQTDGTLNRLSMLTGKVTTLKPYESHHTDPLFDDKETNFICQDYTILNDEIYFIDDYSAVRKYNETTDDYTQIGCKYAFRYIYADEENIYGIACDREENSINHTFHFIKLTINGDTAEGEILA